MNTKEFPMDRYKHCYFVGSNILEKNGYKYFEEIRYHAKIHEKYSTEELDLLYYADLTVDSKGNYVSFEERLKDIISRYGKNSKHVKETEKLITYLKRKGFV